MDGVNYPENVSPLSQDNSAPSRASQEDSKSVNNEDAPSRTSQEDSKSVNDEDSDALLEYFLPEEVQEEVRVIDKLIECE